MNFSSNFFIGMCCIVLSSVAFAGGSTYTLNWKPSDGPTKNFVVLNITGAARVEKSTLRGTKDVPFAIKGHTKSIHSALTFQVFTTRKGEPARVIYPKAFLKYLGYCQLDFSNIDKIIPAGSVYNFHVEGTTDSAWVELHKVSSPDPTAADLRLCKLKK